MPRDERQVLLLQFQQKTHLLLQRKVSVSDDTGVIASIADAAVAPSEWRRRIDVIERTITRCLERDPRQRPASVAQVAAALPGG
jgi:hypothetical protein